jgi:hypothetical protein
MPINPNFEEIRNYVETGRISGGCTEKDILNKIESLSMSEQESLKATIELGLSSRGGLDLLGLIPKATKWAILVGLTTGGLTGSVEYQCSNNVGKAISIAIVTAIAGSTVTFFGLLNKTRLKNMQDAEDYRADKFLERLAQRDCTNQIGCVPEMR